MAKADITPVEFIEMFNEFVTRKRSINGTAKELGISPPTIQKYFKYLCCDHGIPWTFFKGDYKGSCYTCAYISLHGKNCSCPENRGRADLDINKGCTNWKPVDTNLKVHFQ